ncbi:unnamed protein product, partial [Symbiodinium sp. CCMP2592]
MDPSQAHAAMNRALDSDTPPRFLSAPLVPLVAEQVGDQPQDDKRTSVLEMWKLIVLTSGRGTKVEGIQPGPVFQVAGIGLAEGNWAEAWLARRRRLNLVATHSLKATLLSFMAKAAASENLRSIAGYHIRSANSSTLEYSRDSMAPSLHFLEGMFIAIKGGIFAPDSTRAGRWTGGIRPIEEALRFLSGVQPDPPDDRPPPADAPEIKPGDQSDPESAAESIGTEGEADEAVASAFFLGEDLNVTTHGEHAVFLSKCTQLGLPEDARGKLKRKGWATFGTFAFCVPGEPGRIPDDVFKTSVVQPILGDGGEEHQAKLRRLHFEAYALTAAELKRTAESTESDQPRKVPTAELAARYDVLQKRIKPLRLVDRLEPSHALVNLSAQMLEDQRVRYIEWSKCTSRAQEINLVKEDASLKLLQGGRSGSVKLVDPGAKITADTKSDLEVMQALRRRGVAYELAAIMSFERHEELIDRLFMEYQREPMAGFHPVSFSQLQAADREVHVRMGELTRAGLVPGADGSLPLDIPVSRVLAGSHIQWMLMPRQKGSGPLGSSGAGEANEKPDKPPRKPPKKTDPSKATDRGQGADKNQKADSGASPNAAERPGKPRKTRFVMPKALIGGVPKDGAGRNICFDHNLGKCPNAAGACPKGEHVCQVHNATHVHDTATSHFGNDRDTNAEVFAATLIGKVDAGGIRRLLELLPSEAPSRGSREVGRGSEFSFTTGAYTYDHGKRHGLRQHCRDFPMSTKVLNEFMRSMAPGACYTTLALFRDLETRVHSDHGNDPSLMNTILKVSEFSHGGLWVETVGGKVPCPLPHQGQRMGNVVEFANGALSFDAQQPHCVMPWSRGPRVVLVAFSVRNWANLRRADLTELSNLGFKLPTLGPDSTAGPESASSVLPSPGVFPFPPPAPTAALAASPVTLPPQVSVPGTAPAAADHPDLGGSNVARDVTATAQPSFIELFCGSAGLSAEVRKLGFRVLGVDHKPTAKHANAPFVSLDLRDPEQQDRIWVELRRAQAVWIAPPCGTASIARQIPLGRSAK